MAEENCRRELDLEIPAAEVQKAIERVAREFARVARVPGFRPGKAPIPLIRRRFADDIKGEVLQSLLPEQIDKAVKDQKLVPITQPQVDHVDYAEDRPLKFRASFEVLPEIEGMRERAATFVPVEERALESGDFAQLKLVGTPLGEGEPLKADNVLCHLGSEETLESFTQNLVGAKPGEQRRFEVDYPADYPDRKLAGKKYAYSADVVAVKQKKLPELNDELAKDVSDAKTLEELRGKLRQSLEADINERHGAAVREAVLAKIVAAHDFPVPEALVENQMDVRLERAVRSLASQGVDPRAVNVDWVAMRRRQHARAVEDVKAELLLDRIASAENIEATDEDIDQEISKIAERSGESAPAIRANLTKQGAVDRMRSKLRSEKTLEWLQGNSEVSTREPERS
jgi:trigger factor